jgi:hypothetical protein
VYDDPRLSRYLWTVVLTVAVVVVVVNFASRPLSGGEGEASVFSPPITLWVTGAEADGRAAVVAAQAASCWAPSGRSADVGVLPGESSTAVVDFLERIHNSASDLLLITSNTLAEIAHEQSDELLPEEARETAQQAVRLLRQAHLVAVLASDPLALAVRAHSPIHSISQLLALIRRAPPRPLFDVAADAWLRGSLAALVQSAGLHGEVPYGVFGSSREALASLDSSANEIVVAPHSAIRAELDDGRLRELPWPAFAGAAPRAWVAVIGASGLDGIEVAALRSQARVLCGAATWARLVRRDGLSPVRPGSVRLWSFVREGIDEAGRLQALATRIMRDYG